MAYKYRFMDLKKQVQDKKRAGEPAGAYLPADVNSPLHDYLKATAPEAMQDVESIEALAAHETLTIIPIKDPMKYIEVKFNYGIAEGWNLVSHRVVNDWMITRKRHIKNMNVSFGKKE